ncbi:PQQ-binding-like beta-propeller repeat protein [candidate division KSB1 bacterium]|nr:PQQ-binding-like beta-propeller repeat protein [candidate division KSB1 bacterium]
MCRKQLFRIATILLLASTVTAGEKPGSNDWPQFRGPNGSGISETRGLPSEFGPHKNVVWKTTLPAGHSSPVLTAENIFLTAFEGDKLLTFCLKRSSGEVIWRREAPRSRADKVDYRNTPASASPVTDGKQVYVFFPDFGLLAYDFEGNERWQLPLGPFNNIYGMGASPVLVDDKLILVCDQSTHSFIIAVNKNSGKVIWQTQRPEAKSGHSTPVVYETKAGEKQVVVPGSFLLTSYSAQTGEKIWWVKGLSFEMKSTPVMEDGVLYINGYGSPLNQPGSQMEVPSFAEALSKQDADGNGQLSKDEVPEGPASSWFGFVDLESDGHLNAEDWDYLQAALASLNGMLAIRLGGEGDMTDSNILWQYRRAVPQLPSPLLYKDVLYMINDGGIVTSFIPESGEVIKQSRIKGAVDKYYASPVAADNKVFMVSRLGKVSVLDPKGNLEVLAVNDLKEQCYATPAIAGGRIYIRTAKTLYCFGQEKQQ